MVDPQLVARRLVAQGLVTRPFGTPHDVVAAQLAMQGQDLPGVISSLALRLAPETSPTAEDAVDAVLGAFDDGTIVRGYPMRGTVFAVAAEDLRWLTELCAAGPARAQERRRGQLGLDEEQVGRARALLEDVAGEGTRGVSREDLFALWDRHGLAPEGGRGYHVLSYLMATGVAAYGPWNPGAQGNDVVLAEHWLPPGTSIAERFGGDRDAAAAELLLRYLTGHGPATLRDAAWWSKLPLTVLRRVLPTVRASLETDPAATVVGEELWWRPGLLDEVREAGAAVEATHLLPGFDELVLGYPDRTVLVPAEHAGALVPGNNGIFRRAVLRRGRIVGTWRRTGTPGRRAFAVEGFARLPAITVREATSAHGRFPHLGS